MGDIEKTLLVKIEEMQSEFHDVLQKCKEKTAVLAVSCENLNSISIVRIPHNYDRPSFKTERMETFYPDLEKFFWRNRVSWMAF